MAHIHDRFVGYDLKEGHCKYHPYPEKECWHIKMEKGGFSNISQLYAIQLGNSKLKNCTK